MGFDLDAGASFASGLLSSAMAHKYKLDALDREREEQERAGLINLLGTMINSPDTDPRAKGQLFKLALTATGAKGRKELDRYTSAFSSLLSTGFETQEEQPTGRHIGGSTTTQTNDDGSFSQRVVAPTPETRPATVRRPVFNPEESQRRRIAAKVAETQAVDDAEWPGTEKKLRLQNELATKLKREEIAARRADASRKFNEWVLKQDYSERLKIQRARKTLAGNVFNTPGFEGTMEDAEARAAELLYSGAVLTNDVKESTVARNETSVDLMKTKIEQTLTSIEKMRREMYSGIPASALRTYNVRTQAARAELTRIEGQIKSWQTLIAENKVSDKANEKVDTLTQRADELRQGIEDARAEALGTAGGGSVPAKAAPRSSGVRRMKRANLPEAARRMGVSVEEAERRIVADGGVIY